MNFAGIQTTSLLSFSRKHIKLASICQTITQVSIDLSIYPEHQGLGPSKEKIGDVLRKTEGWPKQALERIDKLDNVMRESLRMSNIGTSRSLIGYWPCLWPVIHKAHLPRGTWDVVPTAHCTDPKCYTKTPTCLTAFDSAEYGSRPDTRTNTSCSRLRMRFYPGDTAVAHGPFVVCTPIFLQLTRWIHFSPGRFFAANESKLLLASLVRFKITNGIRPQNRYWSWPVPPIYLHCSCSGSIQIDTSRSQIFSSKRYGIAEGSFNWFDI